ncbi:MAG: hypothetical protein RIT27_927 [Pseudomonadota bacterium]|jgi:hydrogenase nickel incorporation protein HypB
MCDTCGCNITKGNEHTQAGQAAVDVLHGLLHQNDHQAAHNREHFQEYGVLCVNLMSSPGAGKTRLLETTIETLKNDFKIAVIEGDLETNNDAERIRAKGVEAIQITTGTACHLDAHLIHHALHDLKLEGLDILFIENVGNLVCPASFDLGQHKNVVLLSTTEGDDKPAKYPVMFRSADLLLITKTDLLEILEDFVPNNAEQHLRNLANDAPLFQVSAKTNEGFENWLNWLKEQLNNYRATFPKQSPSHPHFHAA